MRISEQHKVVVSKVDLHRKEIGKFQYIFSFVKN